MPLSPVRSTTAVAPGGAWPVAVTVSVPSPPEPSAYAPTATATSRIAAIASTGRGSANRSRHERRARGRARACGSACSASARTVAISRSRSAGGGSTCSTAAGSISTEVVSQRARSWQRGQLVEVALEAARLVARKRIQHVGGEVVLVAQVVVLLVHTPSASFALILSIASRMRPLTVPSGMPSTSAISEWVSPPK